MSKPDFRSKLVLITGASRGLGLALAEAFWAQGADLFILGRSGDSLSTVARGLRQGAHETQRIGWLAVDLRDASAPQRIFQGLRDFSGRLDVLVNNAAILGPIGPLADNDWT